MTERSLHAAAAFRAGLRPDILTDTYGWDGASLLPYPPRRRLTIRAVSDGQPVGAASERIGAAVTPLEAWIDVSPLRSRRSESRRCP